MSATLIGGEYVAGHSALTTAAMDTSGANFLLAVIATFATVNTANISDSKSNSWTWLTTYGASNVYVTIGYVQNPSSVGSGHTLNISDTDYQVLFFYAFSGMHTSSVFDTENGNTNNLNSGSITPAESGELLVSAFAGGSGSGDSCTVDGGFVIEDVQAYVGGTNVGAGVAFDNTYDDTASVSCGWTDISSADNGVTIAAFKLAPAGGGFQAAWARNSNTLIGVQ